MFNQAAVLAKRKRAKAISKRAIGKNDADFLLKIAAEDVADRLLVTNREFRDAIELFSLHDSPALANLAKERSINFQQIGWDNFYGETNLGLEENSLDLVISLFSLHWVDNLPLIFHQVFNALRPDGLFMAVFPGEDTLAELRDVLITAETELCGGASPRVDPFPTINSLGSLLQQTGFALPVIDQDKLVVRYSDMGKLVDDLRAMGCTSSLAHNNKWAGKSLGKLAGKLYGQSHKDADGRIRATFNITHLSGWKPHPNQQKPLKPGSAEISLKEVL